jgi:hypothetical protein
VNNEHARQIYLAAQCYRNWSIQDQPGVTRAFEEMVETIWNAAIDEAIDMQKHSCNGILASLKVGVR